MKNAIGEELVDPNKIFERAKMLVNLLEEAILSRKTEPFSERRFEAYDHNGVVAARWCASGREFHIRPDSTHRTENRVEYSNIAALILSLMLRLLDLDFEYKYYAEKRVIESLHDDLLFLVLRFSHSHNANWETEEINRCVELRQKIVRLKVEQRNVVLKVRLADKES